MAFGETLYCRGGRLSTLSIEPPRRERRSPQPASHVDLAAVSIRVVPRLLLAFAAFAATASAASHPAQTAEREWLDAYQSCDAATQERLLADGFVITYPDGRRQSKKMIVEMMQKAKEGGCRTLRFTTSETKVHDYGGTVVLVGLVTAEWKTPDGKMEKDVSSYSDTWVRRDGRWQVAVGHLSRSTAR